MRFTDITEGNILVTNVKSTFILPSPHILHTYTHLFQKYNLKVNTYMVPFFKQ